MTVSEEVYHRLQPIFNKTEQEVFAGLVNYYNLHNKWPTYKELSEFIGVDKNTVQPRLNELSNDRMVVENGEKRPCTVSEHDISVNTWKVKDHLLKQEDDVIFDES